MHQVDAQRRFERSWGEIQGYLMSVLDAAGVDPITAEELTVIPGAEEVLALLELRTHALSGDWDVIIVDCAPTAETLRLLALPEALGWYMTRVFGVQRRVVKALRPVLTRAAGVPMPEDSVFDAVERLHADLEQVQQILTEKDATVRLVLTPGDGGRRRGAALADHAVAVRLPRRRRDRQPGVPRGWRATRGARAGSRPQQAVLAEVRQSFADVPIWQSVYRAERAGGRRRARRLRRGGVRRGRPARASPRAARDR